MERGAARADRRIPVLLGVLVTVAVVAGAVSIVVPDTFRTVALPAISGASLLFALVHAPASIGRAGAATYFALAYGIGFALEASSVATGFPFGHYEHHTGGPALAGIPLVVPLGYAAYGWIAWVLARALTRGDRPTGVVDLVATPLVAAFVLAGWDFTYDAVLATVEDRYTYRDPGGFFGVPVTNYLGWLLTGWLIFWCFALVRSRSNRPARRTGRGERLLPPVLWASGALPVIGQAIVNSPDIVEKGGTTYRVGDLYASSAVAGLLTLGLVALTAAARVLTKETDLSS